MRRGVCDIGLETDNEGVGGWAALLGPGLGLILVVTLATPAYLARIACRLARRAASISSTGGGDAGNSNSISGSTLAGSGAATDVSCLASDWRRGDRDLRGDILLRK